MLVSNCDFDWSKIKGSTLVLPSISLGNVPQLSIDLLIETLNIPRVGFWDTSNIIPITGPSAYSSQVDSRGNLVTVSLNGEVCYDSENNLTVLQFRAPIQEGMMSNFANELVELFKKFEFKHVIVLSSYDMTLNLMHKYKILGILTLIVDSAEVRWICPDPTAKPSIAIPEGFSRLEVEGENTKVSEEQNENWLPQLPGAGFTRKLLLVCQKLKIQHVTCFLKFVSEGDNREDAKKLATALANTTSLNIAKWNEPSSWKNIFGPNTILELYN